MKYLVVTSQIFIAFGCLAQLPISVYDCSINDPEVTQAEIDVNDDFYKQCILFSQGNNYLFDQDDNKDISARTQIHIEEGFHAGAFSSTGKMHLKLEEKSNLDVFSMNQADLGAIPQYNKFEIGLNLPNDIDARINDFFLGINPSTSLNPFNPEEIDIEANYYWVFNGQEYGPLKTFGFYYEEFERNSNLTEWNEIPQDYNFRVRFAPRNVGKWKCKITVKINGAIVYEANEFWFEVIPSNSLDFTVVGDNQAYFKIGGKNYFPVGQNQPSVGIESTFRQPVVRPPADYLSYHQSIQNLHSTGANYYRMLATPWGVEIEFEELGNYKDRMPNAWEMDRILDLTRDLENSTGKPFRMHFNMMIHFHLETVNVFTVNHWDWAPGNTYFYNTLCNSSGDDGYCYAQPNNQLYPGISHPKPVHFITSEQAKKYYKNRLRYMVARWGYSTSINLFEILSEANNTGIWADLQPVYDPSGTWVTGCSAVQGGNLEELYTDNSSFPAQMYAWHHDMAGAIKQNSAHPHPVAVNYTGTPNGEGVNIDNGDLSYLSSNVDVVTYNHYGLSHAKFKSEGTVIRNFRSGNNSPTIKKPLMYSEIGLSSCDNNVTWKKQILLSGFTGSAGAGIPWQHSHQDGPALASQRLALWQIYGFVTDFFDGRKLDVDDYRSDYWVRDDKKAELLYLRSFGDNNGPKMAIGAVHNLTVNYYTMRDGSSNEDCNLSLSKLTDELSAGLKGIRETVSHDDGGNRLIMTNMGGTNRYEIRWWNPLTGQELGTRTKWSSAIGRLTIEHDDLSDDFSKSILFCQVRHDPVIKSFVKDTVQEVEDVFKGFIPLLDTNAMIKGSEDSQIENNSFRTDIESSNLVLCFPNPTDNSLTIELLDKLKDYNYSLELRDAIGSLIIKEQSLKGQTNLDLTELSSGVYRITVYVNGLIVNKKIVRN